MPEPATFTQAELPKLVQQIAKKGEEEIPEEFFHEKGFPAAIDDTSELWRDKLLIDFSVLSSSSPAASDELAKLQSVLSTWGCFLVINHGMEKCFLEQVIQVKKEFFALPIEEKRKSSSTDDPLQGYSTDAIVKGNQPLNWNDRLFLKLFPIENRNLLLWPEKPRNFSKIVDEYATKLVTMTEAVYRAMARALDVEEECLLKSANSVPTIARFTIYPQCPCPERILGSVPHFDGTIVTVLLSDVEGLQIQKDERWYKVPVIPGALFINIGDFGEVLTNGIFKSVLHRVVTNSAEERTSVATFCLPQHNDEIEPLSKLVSKDQPPLYKKLKVYEYLQAFYESEPLGLRALDAFKL